MNVSDTRPPGMLRGLAGVADAGSRARLAAGADALIALLPLTAAPLLPLAGMSAGGAWTLAALGVLAVTVAGLVDLTRTGQTLARRLLRVRTIGSETLRPPTPRELIRGRLLHADLRRGTDPLQPPVQSVAPISAPEGNATRQTWAAPERVPTGTWRLSLDGGGEFTVEGPTLLGRSPTGDDGHDRAAIALPDPTRSISRVHALVEPDPECLWLTDVGTTNGTRAACPSDSGATVIERWLRPGERVAVRVGGTIRLGDHHVLRVTRSPGRES